MSEPTLSRAVQDSCHQVQRIAVASRDALLFAASSGVDANTLREICRDVAEQLGGQVAELSQLLAASGCHSIASDDERMDRLRARLVARAAASGASRRSRPDSKDRSPQGRRTRTAASGAPAGPR